MAKDSLARGARSATFSGGQAERNDPIEFHGTVAAEEATCAHGNPLDRTCILCNVPLNEPQPAARPIADFAKYEPMNGRILLRKIVEKDNSLVIEPDAFARVPNKAEVLCVPMGEGMLSPGDVVLYGEYNAEDILIDGEKLLLVDIHDIRLKFRN
jgi:co-chaperonin GroES (HSP10)